MAQAAFVAVKELMRLLQAADGLPAAVAELSTQSGELPAVSTTNIVAGYATADLLEKNTTVRYPSFNVYCDRAINKLNEKFRELSAAMRTAAEIRRDSLASPSNASQPLLQGLSHLARLR